MCLPCLRIVRDDTNIYNHVVLEIVITRDKSIAALVLETHAFGGSFVETVEVLDSGNDGVGGIMWEYLHPHGQSSPMIVSAVEQEFECHILGCRSDG